MTDSTDSPATSGYAVAEADAMANEAVLLALWGEGLPQAGRPAAKFDWYYRRPQTAAPRLFLLYAGQPPELAGALAIGFRAMHCDGRPLAGGVLVDFVLRPEHRTLFPALSLQREVRRRMLEAAEGAAVLFGFPNPASVAVVRRAGHRHIGDAVRYARVLRSAAYLRRLLPAVAAQFAGAFADRLRAVSVWLRRRSAFVGQWQDEPGADFDDLWARARDVAWIIGTRDRAFLTWRFVDAPLRPSRFFALRARGSGKLLAYAVCSRSDGGLDVLDFLADPAQPAAQRQLWLALAEAGFRGSYSNLSATFCGHQSVIDAICGAGLIARERQPVCASAGAAVADWSGADRWYLTAADEDG